ncbi:putative dehydrogenase [Inhella inkyongensis]|uniref:Putative dehydrogenase n=1 Tax=Inhella inkyongensis TaxID=392593 RepID=A0A840S4G3_9BURK|nr:Gfo/Idh/MocA family oxidoreductase [Inhella inkyongensis]MBB5204348.1 putative dehydrogenase [Inhella inkyongensis]
MQSAQPKVRMAMVGLGKMGLSHLAIVRAHPQVELVAGCDASAYLTDVLEKHTGLKCYSDFDQMLATEALDALLIATPSKLHAGMVTQALSRGLHVFCEKPFVLDVADGERLVALAHEKQRVTQVGYHYRFVGTFQEAARIVKSGALGEIHHVRAEAYGPVVLRAKGGTWRSTQAEGGGALYDYACHAIDLVNFVVGKPDSVSGVVRHAVFSRDVEDEVYCSLHYRNGASGQLCVNWSDESLRKMSTKLSVWGTRGRLTADRQECQIYLREPHTATPELKTGWNVKYTTELTDEVWFYLRGEEYSAQIDYFVQSVLSGRTQGHSHFGSALDTDRVVAQILAGGSVATPTELMPKPRGFWSRLFG